VGASNPFDHNRDWAVNALDHVAALRNLHRTLNWGTPANPQAAAPAAASFDGPVAPPNRGRPPRRHDLLEEIDSATA
jgi:hypothetical protein